VFRFSKILLNRQYAKQRSILKVKQVLHGPLIVPPGLSAAGAEFDCADVISRLLSFNPAPETLGRDKKFRSPQLTPWGLCAHLWLGREVRSPESHPMCDGATLSSLSAILTRSSSIRRGSGHQVTSSIRVLRPSRLAAFLSMRSSAPRLLPSQCTAAQNSLSAKVTLRLMTETFLDNGCAVLRKNLQRLSTVREVVWPVVRRGFLEE
jgi:hypothetical protein